MSLLLLFQGAGGTDVTVTPGIDTLVLTGFAPTVTATSNATVTPAIDTLVLTGQAPTVSATWNVTVTPANDTIVITGYAPSVTVPTSVTVEPGAGALTITGYAPEVSTGDVKGRLIKRGTRSSKRLLPPQPHPDDELYRRGTNEGPLPEPVQPVQEPKFVEPPKKLTGGFLSRLAEAPEYNQITALRQLADDAVANDGAKTLERLNRTLEALSFEVVRQEQKKRAREAELRALAAELVQREEELRRQMEEDEEDEILLMAA